MKYESSEQCQRQCKAPGGEENAERIVPRITACRENTADNNCIDGIGEYIECAEDQHDDQVVLCGFR